MFRRLTCITHYFLQFHRFDSMLSRLYKSIASALNEIGSIQDEGEMTRRIKMADMRLQTFFDKLGYRIRTFKDAHKTYK